MESTKEMSVKDQVKAIAGQWRDREGNLIMILHQIQGKFGYVPREVALLLSRGARCPVATIYEK